MKKYIAFIISLFLLQASVVGQKDSTKRSATVSIKTTTPKLTVEQEQWIRKNYQYISGMKKDSAKLEIKKNFPSISNSSTDYMISRAGKLMLQDKQKHLAMIQKMMKSLTAQKNALTKKLSEKQSELRKTKDAAKKKEVNDEIAEIKNKIKDVDKEIKYLRESK